MDESQIPMFPGENFKADKRTFNLGVIDSILNHYRKAGFPYLKLSYSEKQREWNELRNLDTKKLLDGKNFISDSTGVSLANCYHPHRYGVVCNDHRTAISVFNREEQLRKCILKCIHMNGKINDSKLRSMISIFEGVQVASNFPPGTAKAIYDHFCPPGGTVWDMSMGFGGRMLAATTSKNVHTYFGTDPSTPTFSGLDEMANFIHGINREFTIVMAQQGSEKPLPENWPQFDFCFTSPPYFNTEKYSRDEGQSFLLYPYQDTWEKYFLGATLRNCLSRLKPGGKVAINIADVESFKGLERATVQQAEIKGLKLVDTYYLIYTAMPGKGKKNKQTGSGTTRREPIFVFKKC